MEDRITSSKLEKYYNITEIALELAKKNINPGKKDEAKEIISMVSCYLNDAEYFKTQGNYVNSFACINYAHGWLDAGSRLGIFNVKDNKLFVVR